LKISQFLADRQVPIFKSGPQCLSIVFCVDNFFHKNEQFFNWIWNQFGQNNSKLTNYWQIGRHSFGWNGLHSKDPVCDVCYFFRWLPFPLKIGFWMLLPEYLLNSPFWQCAKHPFFRNRPAFLAFFLSRYRFVSLKWPQLKTEQFQNRPIIGYLADILQASKCTNILFFPRLIN
jgi:hypothetical protein